MNQPLPAPDTHAPVQRFLAAVKGKHKLSILIYLKHGPRRYSELRRRLAGISERILSKQLAELEREGILSKTVTGDKPPLRADYALTEHGRTLCAVVRQMWDWGEQTLKKDAEKAENRTG